MIQPTPAVASIFWPTDLINPSTNEPLVAVGYEIDPLKTIIIDLIPFQTYKGTDFATSEMGLRPLQPIGTFNFKTDQIPRQFAYDCSTGMPILNNNEVLILYKPPRSESLEYFSIDPITIDIFWASSHLRGRTPNDIELDKYSSKLAYHFPGEQHHAENTKELLRYINLTDYSRSRLRQARQGPISEYASTLFIIFAMFGNMLRTLYDLLVKRTCLYVNRILQYPIIVKRPNSWDDEEEGEEDEEDEGHDDENDEDLTEQNNIARDGSILSLALASHTFHQLNSRIKQFYNLPEQLQRLLLSRTESEALILKGTKFSPTVYIKFYNTVWLIVNDILIGLMISNMLSEHSEYVIDTFKYLVSLFEEFMLSTILWLMNSPAGFKLNNELAAFFGQLVLWVLDFWERTIIKFILDHMDFILKIVTLSVKYCGFSLLVAMTADLFQILNLELHGFYIACARIYRWQCHTLKSLFRLFYGKKYNVLRHRIDSNDYEFDELMSGIIIFTILIYLLPTVAAFYITFACTRLVCMTFVMLLELLLISLNHLPLGVILLRFKNKERLPGGIAISQEMDEKANQHFRLQTKCLGVGDIFHGHISSMMNFNLINYNEAYAPIHGKGVIHFSLKDILVNWKRISPLTIAKKMFVGEMITSFDYKKMF
ncbi:DEKNAAC105065 [Brettanomyces naardenensis]|uniref:DEKNAAC105065 n=1 Tax=Brettanomyces naardenensis TaxID=13370 RepID=A0A448YSH0_BRENA|nr:DEKNAAC105065 [Brettanomyces naardenensis]